MKKFYMIEWNSIVNGIITLLLGVLLLLFPKQSINIASQLIASILLLLGIGYIIRIIQNKGLQTNKEIISLIISIAFIVLSISIFIDPTWIIRMISVVIGLLIIISALLNFKGLMQYKENRTTSYWIYFSFLILLLLLGIFIIVNKMFLAYVLTRLEGISLIINSIITLLLSRKVKKQLLIEEKTI